MFRALKFGAFLLANALIATIATAIVVEPVRRNMPPYALSATVLKECSLSLVCAACIGFGMARVWRNTAAKWTWILPAGWFAIGLIIVAYNSDVLGSPLAFGAHVGAPEMRSFFAFTVPLIGAIAYSLGAYVSLSPESHSTTLTPYQ